MKDFLHRYKGWLTGALTLAIFIGAVVVLRDMLAHLRWSDVLDELQRTTTRKVGWACLCAALSFVALAFHDGLALKIIGRRLSGGRPVLGICVGMQVLFSHGVEHGVDSPGLDEWPGVVERLQAPVVPHMGWNTVEVPAGSMLFEGVEDERFYFVHSYGVRRWELETNGRTREPLVTWSTHAEDRFVAAVENGPLCATQFHPEKSGEAGLQLLRNWVATL